MPTHRHRVCGRTVPRNARCIVRDGDQGLTVWVGCGDINGPTGNECHLG